LAPYEKVYAPFVKRIVKRTPNNHRISLIFPCAYYANYCDFFNMIKLPFVQMHYLVTYKLM